MTAARGLAAVRRFATPERSPGPRCDLCALPVAVQHPHLLDPYDRLLCCCAGCAALSPARHRLVPPVARRLPGLVLTEAAWTALGVPVELAYFRRTGTTGQVTASYPGPAGRIEALVPESAWTALVDRNPEIAPLEPDVAALFVSRGPVLHAWVLSIDRCLALVGMMRRPGQDLGAARDAFLADLERSCRS